MKTILVAIMLMGSTLVVRAQNNTLPVYGNAGFAAAQGVQKTTSYAFRVGTGYQFSDHLTAGVKNFSLSKK